MERILEGQGEMQEHLSKLVARMKAALMRNVGM